MVNKQDGRLFADVFKGIARYVPERKKWFVYDGKRWAADIVGLMVMELAKDMADAIILPKRCSSITGKFRSIMCRNAKKRL